MNKKLICFIVLWACFLQMNANEPYRRQQDWQWQTTVTLTSPKDGSTYTARPFLWIPPQCKKIAAVMVMSTAVIEQAMVEDPDVRAACARRNIAIVWSADQFYRGDKNAKEQIEQMLASFASLSGYTELNTVPWIPCGHSGTNPMARYITMTYPDRVAFTIIHKATAQTGDIHTIPILSTQGEFMEWSSYARDLTQNIDTEKSYADVRNNRKKKGLPLSYFFDPNTGHFDCSRPLLKNIAMWIDDICELRFDKKGNMIPLEQSKGWVTGLPVAGYLKEKRPPVEASHVSPGDLLQMPWYPSKRTAQAAYDMADVDMTRKAQVAGFADKSGNIDDPAYWWRGIARIPYEWQNDGCTVRLNVIPYTRMPNGTYSIPVRNSQTGKDDEVLQGVFANRAENSFTNSGNPIDIEVVSGNFVEAGDNRTFQFIPRFKTVNYFIVRQAGNETYRTSVQVGRIDMPNINEGIDNVITFPTIPEQRLNSLQPIKLEANSSAGVAVRYFVNSGPAYIKEGVLYMDKKKIPVRSKFPFPITVTAYHQGSSTPTAVKTARAVSQTFYITQ